MKRFKILVCALTVVVLLVGVVLPVAARHIKRVTITCYQSSGRPYTIERSAPTEAQARAKAEARCLDNGDSLTPPDMLKPTAPASPTTPTAPAQPSPQQTTVSCYDGSGYGSSAYTSSSSCAVTSTKGSYLNVSDR